MPEVTLGGYPEEGRRRFGRTYSRSVSSLSNQVHSGHHGLGAVPEGHDAWLECENAEHGYEAGDRVPIAKLGPDTGAVLVVSFDAERTYVAAIDTGDITLVSRESTPAASAITPGDWRIHVTPYITEYINTGFTQ